MIEEGASKTPWNYQSYQDWLTFMELYLAHPNGKVKLKKTTRDTKDLMYSCHSTTSVCYDVTRILKFISVNPSMNKEQNPLIIKICIYNTYSPFYCFFVFSVFWGSAFADKWFVSLVCDTGLEWCEWSLLHTAPARVQECHGRVCPNRGHIRWHLPEDTRTPAKIFAFLLPTTKLLGSPSHEDQTDGADVEKICQQAFQQDQKTGAKINGNNKN